MKLKTTMIALNLAAALTAGTANAQDKLPAGSYQIDAAHSKLGFEIPHLVISTVEGSFKAFEGTVELGEDLSKSSTKVSADVGSIDTGVAKRDDHLRSPDFFDAKKFPKMSFVSKKVEGSSKDFKLSGDLTIHGVTKPVTFDAKYLGAVNDQMGNQRIAFKAKTVINRQEFGLKWGSVVEAGPVVGDDVTLELSIEATRPLPKK